jgi:hypothetical protein
VCLQTMARAHDRLKTRREMNKARGVLATRVPQPCSLTNGRGLETMAHARTVHPFSNLNDMLLVSAAVVALLGRPAAGVVTQISSPDARAPAPNVSQFNPRFDSPSASGPVRN